MATKKTYTVEITCDVCKKKETIHEGDPQGILPVKSAVREIGFLNERGHLTKAEEQSLLFESLDLCPECREKSQEKAVRLAREVTKAFGRMAEDFGNSFVSFGKNLQRNMEETE